MNTSNLFGSSSGSFHAELSCYSLPYGVLGFVSHLLTYYIVACLYRGLSPLWPFVPVKRNRFDLIVGALGLTISSTMAIITMARCRKTWELLTIAVWKLAVSVVNGGMGIAIAYVRLVEEKKRKDEENLWELRRRQFPRLEPPYVGTRPFEDTGPYPWLVFYVPAMIAGMSGLLTLVHRDWQAPHVKSLTVGFALTTGILLVIGFVVGYFMGAVDGNRVPMTPMLPVGYGALFFFSAFTFFAALYADWALGLIANNLVGLPSSDNSKFYWTYWAAKRLTMLSF
ncbi:hypothetical protein BDN72DRAFT_791320 [Pluteus cervinus]|uniref:Uncharacterized protein n=1 Tax=Pluteus cervinus TaxID=181527 RepID=A0ACD3B5P1_9AGAR|nr:hypothetical protein BDN72DRAFT_791320 [Pluteus cervinus]